MSYLEFGACDISPRSFTFGRVFIALLSLLLICTGDSIGAGYCPRIMPRPAQLLFILNSMLVIEKRFKAIVDGVLKITLFSS